MVLRYEAGGGKKAAKRADDFVSDWRLSGAPHLNLLPLGEEVEGNHSAPALPQSLP